METQSYRHDDPDQQALSIVGFIPYDGPHALDEDWRHRSDQVHRDNGIRDGNEYALELNSSQSEMCIPARWFRLSLPAVSTDGATEIQRDALTLSQKERELCAFHLGFGLGDVIESGVVPFLRLERIFRQGERSGIVESAHRVNQGRLPSLVSSGSQRDFYFVDAGEPAAAANAVIRICAERIPARFGLRPMRDVQVLCPMNRGDIGVHRLNDRLREALNPAGTEITRFGRTLRVGDRVLQSVNNYDKDVFNGDLGWVTGVDHAVGRITVNFDEAGVEYDFSELDELQPSFAMTVHRAQGGEFPAVVVPLLTQHYPMLQRNLLYTAITRGRRLVVVVGSRRALAMAVRNNRPGERNSMLRDRLSGTGTGGGTAFPEGGIQRLCFLQAAGSPWPVMPHPTFPGPEVALPGAPQETGVAGGPPGGPGSSGGADAVFACAAHRADGTQGGTSVLQGHLFNIP